MLLLLVPPPVLAAWGADARADESGCKASVILVSGDKVTVTDFGGRLLEDSFKGIHMVVEHESGQSIINIRKLARLTRVSPPGEVPRGAQGDLCL